MVSSLALLSSLLIAGSSLTGPLEPSGAPGLAGFDCAAWMGPVRAWGLPVDTLERACGTVDVRYHRIDEWGLALLWQNETDERPVLSLLESVYTQGSVLRPLDQLTVDASEVLFYRLLTVDLERRAQDEGSASDWLRARAGRLLLSVPPEYREEAYREALASFGAHVLSVRLVIETTQRRRLAAGGSLCAHVLESGPLFRLWDGAFATSYFPGQYWIPGRAEAGTEENSGTSRRSIEVLAPVDKRWLIDNIFEGQFVGTARADFEALYCPEIHSAS
ncbi:MAG: hypothetical protein K8J08_02930 [Thermoanaerobaculia bacterium]|nr:hypothetical protein [Thermoanaerobaculia bacterium]